jgi:hypothetical protein
MKLTTHLTTLLLFTAPTAFGHGSAVPHSHPHSNGSTGWLALAALAATCYLALSYAARRRNRRIAN